MIQSGSSRFWQLGLICSLAVGCAIASSKDCTLAQILRDDTLGTESSVVTPNVTIDGLPSDQIDGGARRGANLFHSFREFNIDEERGAYFTNPVGIENILSRVTGENPSKIFGKLGVLGNANLFLINPHGIIFGQNASLDVRGSFVGTTANAIQFDEQSFFSASAPDEPGLLTVNPSALLFNQITAGITNNSTEPAGFAPSGNSRLFGLQVADGRSLLLVGGNLSLDGGGLNALGGRVELAGVAGVGMVGLNFNGNNLHLNIPDDLAQTDISLTNRAIVNTSSEQGGGNIQLWGRSVVLNRSRILATNEGAGTAGEIKIITRKLVLQSGSQVLSATTGEGSGGNLTVNASESVELIGSTASGPPSSLSSLTSAAGNAGNLTINTGRLLIQDGASISTESAKSFDRISGQFIPATGRGGDLAVNASESVELSGTRPDGTPSALLSSTQATGDAGNLKIKTRNLIIQDGGTISAASTGFENSLNQFVPATGRGGDLTISTGDLIVRDGSEISVSSEGTGFAGNLEVTANSIGLENGGKLTSTSKLGRGGGNIKLKDANLLLLRDNSEITTNATAGTGNGGDINIDTDLLIGLENSDITANAIEGRGGKIQINAQGIFGIEPRSKRNPETSDITAFSEKDASLNGVIEINRPQADPNADLVILPTEIIDISRLVAQGCLAGGGNIAAGRSQFVITGRGGLPPNPAEATRSDRVLADLGKPITREENRASAANSINAMYSQPTFLVEANSWVIGSKGEVVLTATTPNVTDIPWLAPTSCNNS